MKGTLGNNVLTKSLVNSRKEKDKRDFQLSKEIVYKNFSDGRYLLVNTKNISNVLRSWDSFTLTPNESYIAVYDKNDNYKCRYDIYAIRDIDGNVIDDLTLMLWDFGKLTESSFEFYIKCDNNFGINTENVYIANTK